MKRKTFIILIYILISFHCYPENPISKDTVVFLNEYKVINKNIYHLLDSAIIHELRFFRRNCTFQIVVYSENGRCMLSIAYVDKEMAKYYFKNLFGYFNYKDCLFVIRSDSKAKSKKFFAKCKKYKPFAFSYYSGEFMPTIDETSWFYFYKKGNFYLHYLFDIRIKE
jgi:hypothetical protein